MSQIKITTDNYAKMKPFIPGYVLTTILLLFFITSCEITQPPLDPERSETIKGSEMAYLNFQELREQIPDCSDAPFDFFSIRGKPHPNAPQQGVLSTLSIPILKTRAIIIIQSEWDFLQVFQAEATSQFRPYM